MFSTQFKISITLIILGFICGICMSILFFGCAGCGRSKVSTTTTELRSKAKASDSSYKETAQKLDTVKKNLQQKAVANKTSLANAKSTTHYQERKLRQMIEPTGYPVSQLLNRIAKPSPDTVFTHCDSLKNEIGLFLNQNHVKDSLYEKQISTLDSMVLTQDAIIKNDSLAYARLQGLYTQAIDYSAGLENEKAQLQKKIRRQKTKSKIASFGLMVLTGFATNYLLRH